MLDAVAYGSSYHTITIAEEPMMTDSPPMEKEPGVLFNKRGVILVGCKFGSDRQFRFQNHIHKLTLTIVYIRLLCVKLTIICTMMRTMMVMPVMILVMYLVMMVKVMMMMMMVMMMMMMAMTI